MKLFVVSSELIEKAGKESSFAIRGLVPGKDGKGYRIFERKHAKSGQYIASQFVNCSLVEGGEIIEAGDVIELTYNAGGYIESCKKIPNEKLSIQIMQKPRQ